jgi:hypothetical protein
VLEYFEVDKATLKSTLVKVFAVLQRLPGIDITDRTGFAYTMGEQFDTPDCQNPLLYQLDRDVLGVCSPHTGGLLRYFSLTKVIDLMSNPMAGKRPIQNRIWGGDIRFCFAGHNLLLAVSGLPRKCEEAICVVTAYQMDWITAAQVSEYAELSGNQVIAPLLNACK